MTGEGLPLDHPRFEFARRRFMYRSGLAMGLLVGTLGAPWWAYLGLGAAAFSIAVGGAFRDGVHLIGESEREATK